MTFETLRCSIMARLSSARPVGPSGSELLRRRAAVALMLDRAERSVFVGFSSATVQYLTRYQCTNTERPVAVVLDRSGDVTLFISLLRSADAEFQSVGCSVETYPEYPGDVHPMELLAKFLSPFAPGEVVLEAAGYVSEFGYDGPSLAALIGNDCLVDERCIRRLRMIKSAEEVELIRHASDWSLLAQCHLHQELGPDVPESQIAGRASGAAMRHLRAVLGDLEGIAWPLMVSASCGGQIGPSGTADHTHRYVDPVVSAGDLVITKVGAYVGGYYSDIERTMVVGEASQPVRDLFAHGLEIQSFALNLIRADVAVKDIDRKVRQRYTDLWIDHAWRHHVGHSVGLLPREEPYLDRGSEVVLAPGMVVTVEPGVYLRGIGGFRHSDCVLVTDTGCEVLTDYPRSLEELTV